MFYGILFENYSVLKPSASSSAVFGSSATTPALAVSPVPSPVTRFPLYRKDFLSELGAFLRALTPSMADPTVSVWSRMGGAP